MKSRLSPACLAGCVEPLESRIAPARVILVGLPDFQGNDTNYTEANPADNLFVNTEANPADHISAAVGPGNTVDDPLTPKNEAADTFYLRLGAGDHLQIYNGNNSFEDFLVVKKGSVVAFFVDRDLDNEVDDNELTGLSLSKDAVVEVRGGVAGDIVSNLNDHGTSDPTDDTVDMTGLVSYNQGIGGLTIGASVGGSIISGGSIKNVSVQGDVKAILTGTAAAGREIDFFPGVTGGNGTLAVSQPAGKVGPSISRIAVDSISERIEAGVGGAGAAGGALNFIQVTEDTNGFTLKAGDGGDAVNSTGKAGAGGAVKSVYIASLPDSTNNDLVSVLAGAGGRSNAGVGGAGGSVSQVFVGYQFAPGHPIESIVLSPDDFLIAGGAGGAGKIGGKGGDVFNLDARFATPDATGNEFHILGGAGGNNIFAGGGAAGTGGSIRNVEVRDQFLPPNGDIVLEAGDGGAALGQAKGGTGGNITGATLLGSDFRIVAGDGSTGKTGGTGGSLLNISLEQGSETLAHNAEISAGFGGDGTGGNGGNGGSITNFLIKNGDFSVLRVNQGTQADGGNSVGGHGGKGGSVTGFKVIEFDSTGSNVFQGDFTLRAGNGGSGEKGGGAGGGVSRTAFEGEDMNVSVNAGHGGNATVVGKGGAGGAVQNVAVTAEGEVNGLKAFGFVAAGVGGDGAGQSGAGGKGGDIRFSNIFAAGSVSLTAGNGGSGTTQAAGSGGSIVASGGYGVLGTGVLRAGDAGVGGARPGNGGSILGQSNERQAGLFAANELTIRAGDGTHGGSGGSIRFLGYGSAETDLTPTPIGNILVQAGNGSAEGSRAGSGGSLFDISGALAATDSTQTVPPIYNTTIRAGAGGGAETAHKAGAGGSIANLTLERGGHKDSVLTIAAGDGGSSGNASAGGKGGQVKGVYVSNIDDGTILRSIAAGDGGSAQAKGGLGGSIQDVHVLGHDIGVRMGQAYGYTTMGGLFAGAGGNGAKDGLNGSVKNVTAEAIAVIVAGKGAAPKLVEVVDKITIGTVIGAVGSAVNLLDAAEGDLDLSEGGATGGDPRYRAFVLESFMSNNLVGAVQDPTRVDGNKFRYDDANQNGKYDLGEVPIDGLIAAKNLVRTNLNFVAEAFFDGTTLIDHDNTFTIIS
ncbi:hypothetical protein ACXR0O_18635 [Verrucomicrobiota bacterium sgz303538]